MVKTLVLYESKYGFTKEIAKDAALVLGSSAYFHAGSVNKDINCFDVILICTPVYNDILPQSIMDFVANNAEILKSKRVILFCCCLEVDNGKVHLKPIREILGSAIVWQEIIGAKIEISHLNSNDYNDLKKVCEKDEISFKDNDLFTKERYLERLLKVKHIIGDDRVIIGRDEGMLHVENFLKKHNTCTLGTGYLHSVRTTPMEYIYIEGHIYLMSDAGEKFYYILQNPNVSVSIYDNYISYEEIGGLQIQGTATIIDTTTEEYYSIMKEKGLSDEMLGKSEITPYLIRVDFEKIDFEWSEFEKMGYSIKQIFR